MNAEGGGGGMAPRLFNTDNSHRTRCLSPPAAIMTVQALGAMAHSMFIYLKMSCHQQVMTIHGHDYGSSASRRPNFAATS